MKKIIAWVVCHFMLFSFANAQPSLDMGKVVLSIQPVNFPDPGAIEGNYVFTMDNGSPIGFEKVSDGDYTDITFTGSFEKNNKTTDITGTIRIAPSGEGTFIFPRKIGDNPPQKANLSITINGDLVLMYDETKASGGQVIITHYPTSVGNFLTGTFTTTLTDNPLPKAGHLYKISGSFKIKRIE